MCITIYLRCPFCNRQTEGEDVYTCALAKHDKCPGMKGESRSLRGSEFGTFVCASAKCEGAIKYGKEDERCKAAIKAMRAEYDGHGHANDYGATIRALFKVESESRSTTPEEVDTKVVNLNAKRVRWSEPLHSYATSESDDDVDDIDENDDPDEYQPSKIARGYKGKARIHLRETPREPETKGSTLTFILMKIASRSSSVVSNDSSYVSTTHSGNDETGSATTGSATTGKKAKGKQTGRKGAVREVKEKWTDDEVKILVEKRTSGLSFVEVAKASPTYHWLGLAYLANLE